MTQSSASQPLVRHSASVWLVRAALAALILFGSQILFWMEPEHHSPLEWLLLVAGCLALSTALLDFAVRWRIYDLFGLLLLAGIGGLGSGLLLNPQLALTDVPRTLVTRVVSLDVLAGLAVLALAGALSGESRKRWRLAVAVIVVGLIWGQWAHWSPLSAESTEVSLPTVLVYGGVLLILAAILTVIALGRAANLTPDHLRLSLPGWLAVLLVGVGIVAVRLAQNQVDTVSLVSIPTLMAFCAFLLRFQRRARGDMWLSTRLPHAPISPVAVVIPFTVFLVAGIAGYFLPRAPDPDNLTTLLGAAFTAFGLVWLPMVSLVLGARAFIKEIRTMRL